MSILDQIPLSDLRKRALKVAPDTKIFFARLKRKKPNNLDDVVHQIHDEVFEDVDCLKCANCCKSISPTLYEKDIERLAKYLKVKPSQLVDEYLQIDEENDYVFRKQPCPFLLPDNYCIVYEARPKACREYPHTDRKRFYQILDLTLKNTEVCPAAFDVVARLKEEYK